VGTAYVLTLVAGFSLLWFLTGLRSYVRDLEGTDGSLMAAAFGGGLVYISPLGVGVAVSGPAITGPGL